MFILNNAVIRPLSLEAVVLGLGLGLFRVTVV